VIVRLEITRRAELAVRALKHVARSEHPVKGTALAAVLDATSGFVPQVMAPLVRAGWVTSNPGPTGGYSATVDLAGISVLDVIEAVDGPTDSGKCVVADSECDGRRPCVLHDAWARARTELIDALGAVNLDSLDLTSDT
jgi:Rrf2 family protein